MHSTTDYHPCSLPSGKVCLSQNIFCSAITASRAHSAGPMQLCAGQIGGFEAGVHAFSRTRTHRSGATRGCIKNTLNRHTALFNIQRFCAALATPSLIHTVPPQTCLRTAMYSSRRKGPLKGTLWPCRCIPSQQYRLLY